MTFRLALRLHIRAVEYRVKQNNLVVVVFFAPYYCSCMDLVIVLLRIKDIQ